MSVRITAFGKLFLFVITAMLLATLNYNNSQVYLLVFVMLSLYLVTFLKGWLSLKYARLDLSPMSDVFLDMPLKIEGKMQLANRSYQQMALTLNSDQGAVSIPIAMVAGDQSFTVMISDLKRGKLRIDRAVISSRYPLGLFRWSRTLSTANADVWVFPAAIDLGIQFKASAGKLVDDGQEFDELVNWHEGEGLAGICWKTYARTGRKMRKQFTEYEDTSSPIFEWGALGDASDEDKLSQLCFWIVEKQKKGEQFTLKLPHVVIEGSSGADHYVQCLKALAAYKSGEHYAP